jgi:hypothetical protein
MGYVVVGYTLPELITFSLSIITFSLSIITFSLSRTTVEVSHVAAGEHMSLSIITFSLSIITFSLSRTTVEVSHVAAGEHMVPEPFHYVCIMPQVKVASFRHLEYTCVKLISFNCFGGGSK